MSNHDERQGILLPIVLPIGLLCAIALVLFGFSRILLASSAHAAVAVALTALLAVIGIASFVAARPRISGASLVSMVTAVLGVTMLAGGLAVIAAPLATEGEGEAQTVVLAAPPGAAAEGFSTDSLEVASDVPIDLEFDNQDPSVGHNVVIFDGDDENAPVLVQGTVITGPDKATYAVEALPEGTYFFHCELHPATMVGELSSVPGGGGTAGGGAGAPGETTVSAQGLQFDTDQIDLPAGQPSSITFDNQDAGIPHNIAIYGDDSLADVLFQGELLTGPGSIDYAIPALDAGDYYFHCDVHPDMQGTVVVAAGGGGGAEGGGGAPDGGAAGGAGGAGAPGETTVLAQGLQFDTDQIDLPAGQPSSITFDNQDAGIPHNIAIYGDDSLADVLFQGELLTGPGSTDYAIPALDAGDYYFHCDVHPDMQGSVVVAAGG